MGDGYSRSPRLLKGAIVQFVEMPIVPIPNIIVFQYNPDTLQRTLTPYAYTPPTPATPAPAAAAPGATPANSPSSSNSQAFDPGEEFTLSLLLDASDALEEPTSAASIATGAVITGVAARMAALEMLLYPTGASLLGGLSVSVNVSLSGVSASASLTRTPAERTSPITLFAWGPGRIVPVRLKSFSVEEQQWNQLLYPTRAKVSVGMRVLSDEALGTDGNATSGRSIAAFCYKFTRAQKEILALLNFANTVDSIIPG